MDISKCIGKGCNIKEKCYRYTAPSSDYQSYSEFWLTRKKGECEYFWDNSDRK